jgi:hypothetical protein
VQLAKQGELPLVHDSPSSYNWLSLGVQSPFNTIPPAKAISPEVAASFFSSASWQLYTRCSLSHRCQSLSQTQMHHGVFLNFMVISIRLRPITVIPIRVEMCSRASAPPTACSMPSIIWPQQEFPFKVALLRFVYQVVVSFLTRALVVHKADMLARVPRVSSNLPKQPRSLHRFSRVHCHQISYASKRYRSPLALYQNLARQTGNYPGHQAV